MFPEISTANIFMVDRRYRWVSPQPPFQLIVSGHASVGSGDPEPHNFRRNGTGPDYRKPRVLLIWAFKEIYYFGCPRGFPLLVFQLTFQIYWCNINVYGIVPYMPGGRNIVMERSETLQNKGIHPFFFNHNIFLEIPIKKKVSNDNKGTNNSLNSFFKFK